MSNRLLELALLFHQARHAARESTQRRGLRRGGWVSDQIMTGMISDVKARLNWA
jgi:hypothetical protein